MPYHAHNDEYMCIVSGGSDFMESMSEYMEVLKRDGVVFTHFQVWCTKGLFMTILRCWDFLRRWNGILWISVNGYLWIKSLFMN